MLRYIQGSMPSPFIGGIHLRAIWAVPLQPFYAVKEQTATAFFNLIHQTRLSAAKNF
jgi:hypothetical protein